VEILSRKSVPPEFASLIDDEEIPWSEIIKTYNQRRKKNVKLIDAFTDTVVDMATKESMKEQPSSSILVLGLHACLVQGRLAEALFLSNDSDDIRILSLRGIVLFVLSEIDALREIQEIIRSVILLQRTGYSRT
jgi:hypothetical protein